MLRIRSPQDFGAAVVFIAIGLAGVYFGSDLRFGTAAGMGPGYFPVVLSWVIVVIGGIVGIKAVTVEGPRIEPVQLRPLIVIIPAILIFGYLIDKLGLAITAALLTILAAFARGPRIEPVQVLAILIIILGILIWGYWHDRIDLAIAAALLTYLAAFAVRWREVSLVETSLLAAGLSLFCVGLFVYALSQPFPAWWGR
jgi:hypothetical protein